MPKNKNDTGHNSGFQMATMPYFLRNYKSLKVIKHKAIIVTVQEVVIVDIVSLILYETCHSSIKHMYINDGNSSHC